MNQCHYTEFSPVKNSHYKIYSFDRIDRAESAITGIDENSCRSALVTGGRMPGMVRPTASASTPTTKNKCCRMVRNVLLPEHVPVDRRNTLGHACWFFECYKRIVNFIHNHTLRF